MENYLSFINWANIEKIIFIITPAIMIFAFNKDIRLIKKILEVGIIFFLLSLAMNVLGFIEISDGLSALAFIIVAISSISLLWSETKK